MNNLRKDIIITDSFLNPTVFKLNQMMHMTSFSSGVVVRGLLSKMWSKSVVKGVR